MMAKAKAPHPAIQGGDAAAVARRVEAIEELIQVHGNFERYPIPQDDEIEGGFGIPVAQGELSGNSRATVVVHLAFELTVGGKADDDEPQPDSDPERRLLTKVEATFVVRYRLSEGPPPKPEDLQAFAHANGAFNVNPYWREYLSNSLVRAGLPPIIAPVMKVAQGKPDKSRKSDSD